MCKRVRRKVYFLRFTTSVAKDALARVAGDVAFFAEQEGLTAHAKSAVIRLEE